MLLVVEFYIRTSLEVASLIKKIQTKKLGINEDKIGLLWGVYSREPTLAVINGVL
jgi:hypothetical protein